MTVAFQAERGREVEQKSNIEQIIYRQIERVLDAWAKFCETQNHEFWCGEIENLIGILLPYMKDDHLTALQDITKRYMDEEKKIREKTFNKGHANPIPFWRQKFNICHAAIRDIRLGLTERRKSWWEKEVKEEKLLEDELNFEEEDKETPEKTTEANTKE